MVKTILLIEDDPALGLFLEQALLQQGYVVQPFCSAEPALDALLCTPVDLIITSAKLPGFSGLEFCQALRQFGATATLPVLMLVHGQPEAEIDPAGLDHRLEKPFTLGMLLQTVASCLGSATPIATAPLEVQGKLTATPLPQLLHACYSLRVTGLLHLQHGTVHKVLYLREGYPIFARSNLVRECLGQQLVQQGRISQKECEESLCHSKASGRLQGTVLIDMGLLSPQQMHQALQAQAREKILEVFTWPQGHWRFLPAKDFRKEITAIDLSPASLILQGLRRGLPAGCLESVLQQHRGRYLVPAASPLYRFQEIDLSAEDEQLWRACDGTRTLEELLALRPFERRSREQLLAALLLAEMLESQDVPEQTAADTGDTRFQKAQMRQRRESFLAEFEQLMPLDHFALLEVDEQASAATIRKAYFTLVKRLHPDHYHRSGFSPELMAKVVDLFQRVSEAYAVLTDPARRQDYLARQQGETVADSKDIAEILRAEESFQKGVVLLRRQQYPEAFAILGWAYELQPEEPEYLTAYAWAMFKAHPDQPQRCFEARQLLLHSADLNPRLDLTHLYLGYLLKSDGQDKPAERAFEMALQCNPNNIEALRELRLSNLRREQEGAPRGLLGRLLR
ncbi:MAG: DUF4388 domain-containing protein [Trichloromonadaceae bacterium]